MTFERMSEKARARGERERWAAGLARIYFRGAHGVVFSGRVESSIPSDDLRALRDVGLVERAARDALVRLTPAGLVARGP